jgi:uncharacterized protein (UPF0264 family)
LLVSVRSTAEAIAAVEGGADLVDVKEPSRGSLGRADDAAVAAIVQAVGGRKPVSAAWGELREHLSCPQRTRGLGGLCYVKWGLARCGGTTDWPSMLDAAAGQLPSGCRPVAVGYADWQRAAAPTPWAICRFGCAKRWGAFLLDTWQKDGKTLLDFLATSDIRLLVEHCRDAGLPVALAGSLGMREIKILMPVAPGWFAVRGAACRDEDRNGAIDRERVRQLAALLGLGARRGRLVCASD